MNEGLLILYLHTKAICENLNLHSSLFFLSSSLFSMALAQDATTGAHEPGHPAVRSQPDAQFVVEKSSTPLAQSADAVHNNEEVSYLPYVAVDC
jgi:hypothetical protein